MYLSDQKQTAYGTLQMAGQPAQQAHFAQQDAAKRLPEVIDEIDQLARSTDLLEKTVETLLPRLQPVSNQCGNDAGCAAQAAPAPVLCGIAQSIRNKRQQIDYVQEQLLRAIHALEI